MAENTAWFQAWAPDDTPAVVHRIQRPADWQRIRGFYAPYGHNAPLERVIEIAGVHGVRSVVVERRYIDLDFRSEHSRFYSGTFRRYPSVCHRLHFFSEDIDVPDGHA